MSYYSESNLTV